MEWMASSPAEHTVDQTQIFGLLGGLLILAFFANRVSRRTRVPDPVILMITGVILGPLLGWIHADEYPVFTQYLGTFALILILFEAGNEFHLREAMHHFPAGILFAVLAYGTSFAAVAAVGFWALHLPPHKALLLGGVFGCTSGTIVIPVLQEFRIRGPVMVVLVLEAALGDVIAVILVGSLTDIAEGDPLVAGLVRGILIRTAVATCAAIAAGVLWSRARRRFTSDRFSSVLHVGVVLLVYELVRAAGGSGLMAVLAFGLTLANVRNNKMKENAAGHNQGILVFHSDLSFLVRSFFFVLLGVSVQLIGRTYAVATTLILAGLVAARILSVYAAGWAMRGVSRSGRELILSLFPRGLVNAVLAIQVADKDSSMAFLPAMAFTVILVTNLLVVLAAFRVRSSDHRL
jgi:cell volume regulation protein A